MRPKLGSPGQSFIPTYYIIFFAIYLSMWSSKNRR